MKIAIVTRAMTLGGAERVIAQLSQFFVRQGHICTIFTMNIAETQYKLDARVELKAIGQKSDHKIIDRILRYKALRRSIMESDTDIVLSLPEDTGIYVILSMLGSGIPVYVSERNNPWVMPDSKVTRFLRRIAYPFAQGIIFQTQMAKSFFPERIQKKGIVLSNPVDADRIPEQYQGVRKKVIVGVGRLEKQKNFPLLIQAFRIFYKEHSEYQLYIYGEGSLREELQDQIDQAGLSQAIFLLGQRKNILEEIRDCAMFVLSSDYEGSPNVLIEAMCMGMPVISTDCPSGGPRELIEDGKNGILVPVNDADALSQAMACLTDQSAAGTMAVQAYELRYRLTSEEVFYQWMNYLTEGGTRTHEAGEN